MESRANLNEAVDHLTAGQGDGAGRVFPVVVVPGHPLVKPVWTTSVDATVSPDVVVNVPVDKNQVIGQPHL